MAGLLRYQIFLSYGILIIGIWYTAVQNKAVLVNEGGETSSIISIPVFSSLPRFLQEAMIDYLPFWLLLCLAIYAVGSIAYGVVNFRDCPDAALEVERNIEEAKTEMKKREIID